MPPTAIPEATRQQLSDAIAHLRAIMPAEWTVDTPSPTHEGGIVAISNGHDNGKLTLIACKHLEPKDIPKLPDPSAPTIVASTWLSPRTRALLRARGIGFIDATGNVDITMNRPGLIIRTDGAARDPNPKPATAPTLRGPRAWALLRTFIEVVPPYGIRELATSLGVDAGYVSRVVKVLESELLVERRPRGAITSVDWQGLLRRLASTYSFFGANQTTTWVAPGGAAQLLDDLAGKDSGMWAVTGSFASSNFVPVAAPERAFVYTPDAERLAKVGRLLPATTGSNVVLAIPYDEIVFDRVRQPAEVRFVSVTQAVLDDLTGTGRMPEEGEALIGWMSQNLDRWQSTSLTSPNPDK